MSGCGGWWCCRVVVLVACVCAACPMRNTGMNRGFYTSGQNACCDNTACGVPCRAGWLFQGSWLQLSPFLDGHSVVLSGIPAHPAGTELRCIHYLPTGTHRRSGISAPVTGTGAFQPCGVVSAGCAVHHAACWWLLIWLGKIANRKPNPRIIAATVS